MKSSLLILAAALFAQGCSALPENANVPAHHRSDGTFVNTDGLAINKSFSDLIRWNWERVEPDAVAFPVTYPPAAALADPAQDQITWIGHSTFLIQQGGFNVLTDPHLSERASPFSFAGPQRVVPPAVALNDLPPVDAVVISHNHYDHLDQETIEALANSEHPPMFYVPLQLADWFRDLGITRVTELDWWQSATLKKGDAELTVHAVPVKHWSARGIFDRNKSLWAGWVIDLPGQRLMHVGDSGYSKDFADIAGAFPGIDLALIPIGAYDPRWFMKDAHMSPEEAVQVFTDLKAERAIGMHWGTFILTDEEMTEPPLRLRKAAAAAGLNDDRFLVIEHGATIDLK